jgi:hypothetical protein
MQNPVDAVSIHRAKIGMRAAGPIRSEGVAAFMNDARAFVVKARRLMR